MRRILVLFSVAVMALGIPAMVHAETIVISQDFDNTTTFPLGEGGSTAFGPYGDASTTAGLWGEFGQTPNPKVVSDQAHSGTQSIYVSRTSTNSGKLYGDTNPSITEGIVQTTIWFRRDGNSGMSCGAYNGSTPVAALYFNGDHELHVLAENASGTGDAWVKATNVTLPVGAWFGVRVRLDMDAVGGDTVGLAYHDGTTTGEWVTQLSGETAPSNGTSINRFRFTPQSPTGGGVWIDDCDLRVVPEPGTMAMLATGLIGLLCCAWRRRK